MESDFCKGWAFAETPLDTAYLDVPDTAWVDVDLPHDFLITDVHALYRDATGWYKKTFPAPAVSHPDDRVFLSFDGIYMDSRFYLNGEPIGEWKYGYSECILDLTQFLKRDGENELLVSVRHQSPNSRWYSGAGIFRRVTLFCKPATSLVPHGVYFHAEKLPEKESDEQGATWEVTLQTEIDGPDSPHAQITHTLITPDGHVVPWEKVFTAELLKDAPFIQGSEDRKPVRRGLIKDRVRTVRCVEMRYHVKDISCWDIDDPVLYTLKTTLTAKREGQDFCAESPAVSDPAEELTITETAQEKVGFRTVTMDPQKGFFLNGRKRKLNGVCEHHDLGALGAAFHRTAFKRKLKKLRAIGVNAIRLTHNMAAAEVLTLADEMGFLLISEAFDMWMRPKTTYDYARFFADWYARDVESWVRRDRNHPSVFLWSIGNEIYDTHADKRGERITVALRREVERHDPKKNALVTSGSNYMPWAGAQKCAEHLEAVGYNYAEKFYAEHHEKHPDWVIYGSETSSIVTSRGVYHFPLSTDTLSEEDEQCSSLGNSRTSWGARSFEECAGVDRDLEYSLGQFLWSGFDYIGEPTPYQTKNSYFGQIDTAGFFKDAAYFWQSVWTDPQEAPMIHIIPCYWDFNEGQMIDVRVVSNLDQVELFRDGVSLGKKTLTHAPASGLCLYADYRIPYHPGSLYAVAYDAAGKSVISETIRSFGDTASFVVEREEADADDDLLFYEISAVDDQGQPVGNAADRVLVRVEGPGVLAGTDNGDSTDEDSYQAASRRLFNGKLLAIVKKSAPDVDPAAIRVIAERDPSEIPVRRLTLTAPEGQNFHADKRTLTAKIMIFPPNATDQEIQIHAVSDTGIDSHLVSIDQMQREADGSYTVTMTARGDGAFRLRACSKSGSGIPRILSELEFFVEGIGAASLDPYGFIAGCQYSAYQGEVGCGNEKGVSSARDGRTVISWENLDFGRDVADRITIPIFALNDDPYSIRIWQGIPGEEDAKLLADVVYQKPSVWNVYQEESWALASPLTGLQTISLEVDKKFHIKGFTFHRIPRAFATIFAGQADAVYGDQFRREGNAVCDIGNNVALVFSEMDFGETGADTVCISGRGSRANSVHIRFEDGDGSEITQLIEFPASGAFTERSFALDAVPDGVIRGRQNVRFVFLPGTAFDLESFTFCRKQDRKPV